ncbi:MAG TPA: hypothetical protein VNT23_06115 [Gaiellaceae bacterium]|nr:hypothetical protein [Gaiellaceae bacterium]
MDGLLQGIARARYDERTELARRAAATGEPAPRARECPLERLAAWLRSRRRHHTGAPVRGVQTAQ